MNQYAVQVTYTKVSNFVVDASSNEAAEETVRDYLEAGEEGSVQEIIPEDFTSMLVDDPNAVETFLQPMRDLAELDDPESYLE